MDVWHLFLFDTQKTHGSGSVPSVMLLLVDGKGKKFISQKHFRKAL